MRRAAKRSAVMRQVKGKDTAPERQVRRLIWSLGGRYRLHRKDIPGKQDKIQDCVNQILATVRPQPTAG